MFDIKTFMNNSYKMFDIMTFMNNSYKMFDIMSFIITFMNAAPFVFLF
jgi:hypothetical protein